MLAGLITRVILIPAGALAGTPDIDRILAISLGFIVFFFFNRNIFYGTGTAFFAFLCATAVRHFGVL
jgi:hypothetical protein